MGPAPAASGRTVVARRGRAADRAARRRRARTRRLLAVGLVVALLAVAAGAWWFLAGRGSGSGRADEQVRSRQRTLLVQVAGPDGTALATSLIGVQSDQHKAVSVLIPSRLLVDAAGAGTVPFGETLALPDKAAPANALTDLLGVTVDGSWVLTTRGLAALVDRVGGVNAEVDVDVVAKDAAGRDTIVVRAGSQHLGGAAAAAYATYAAPGEPEQARLARFSDVLDGVLHGLPQSTGQVSAALSALGAGSRSSGPAAGDLAQVLTAVRAAAGSAPLLSDVLPVNEIDTGAAEQAYGIDGGQASALVRSRFAGALQQGNGSAIRVLVENGVGTPGLVEQARSRLVKAGLRFVNGGNAAEFNFTKSVVLIPDGTEQSQDRGRKVASALGVPSGSIAISSRGQTVAEVIVILGRDFRP